MALEFHVIPVTAFQQNCSLLICSESRAAVLIDPGGDLELIEAQLEALGAELKEIWLTHGHLDHAGASRTLADRCKVPLIGPHEADRFWLQRLEAQAQNYGLPAYANFEPDRWLTEQDTLKLGEYEFQVIHCPGHTPGHVVFYQKEEGLLIAGDVLFAGSIGRTDFPMSCHEDLVTAIKTKLFTLPEAVCVAPGHGPTTTIGREKKSNPYVGKYT
jgi:hydroxyacylglutathione hydrolase